MNLTQFVILACFILLLGYDALVSSIGQPTESRVLMSLSFDFPSIALMFGILLGHWFWPHKAEPQMFHSLLKLNLGPIPFLLLSFGFDFLHNHFYPNSYPAWRFPGFYTLLGIPIGSLFWYQINASSLL